MNTGELFGKEVLDAGANKIGKVVDLDFDLRSGTINNLLVKSGLTKKLSLSLDKIDKIGDRLVLNVAEEALPKK
jgi:sporulation protein YlmC with PRC-barrel domain